MLILLVDDSPSFLAAASDALEAEGYTVETAKNGIAGVNAAHKWKPDLIIMDIEMPKMNGDEATREIKKDPDLAKIPIIAMTSHSPESLSDALELFDDYLVKPFDFPDMIPKVSSLLLKKGT